MQIFITGASGFIGSHLTERLLKDGHKVTAYVRHLSNLKWLADVSNNKNLSVTIDLKDLQKYDKVYHIAGILGKKEVPMIDYVNTHVKLTYELLKLMNKEQHFIYMSTSWIHAIEKAYEITKLDGEYLVYASGFKNATIVRPGFVYGERDLHHLLMYKLVKYLGILTPIIGSGENKICPTYVHDVIQLLIDCQQGILYPVGNPIKVKDYLGILANHLHVLKPIIRVPYLPEFLKEPLRWNFFAKERVFPSNINPTPLDIGVSNTIKWYNNNKLL